MNELKNKIHGILKVKFPEYGDEQIEEMIQDYGEIAVMKTLNQTFDLLVTDEERQMVGSLFGRGMIDQAFEYADERGVDMNEIFEENARQIVMEIFEPVE